MVLLWFHCHEGEATDDECNKYNECYAELVVSSLAVAVTDQWILKLCHCLLECLCSVCGVVHLRVRKADGSKPHTLEAPTSGITYWQIIDESSVVHGTYQHRYFIHSWNECKCIDLKCVQKPTRGRLSLTHLPVQPLSMVRESV